MKTVYSVALSLALLVTSAPVHASKTDDRIESSTQKSYVFKTYLKGDDVKVESKKTHRTTGEKVDDASITALCKMTLLYHRSTSALNTTVETKHGVVTVGGKAKNTAEKDLVTKLVGDVNGVKSVTNHMTI